MGCFFFSYRSSTSSSSTIAKKTIRIVHINGHIEDFDHSVTVYEIIGRSNSKIKHFLCTRIQLFSTYPKPLLPNSILKPGEIYFLLPFSVFQSILSSEDFVPIAKKLVSIANRKSWKITEDDHGGKSPNNAKEETAGIGLAGGLMRKSTKSRSWKPFLATIRERSFNRRSESDLQEKS